MPNERGRAAGRRLAEILQSARDLSEWTTWLVTSPATPAAETRAFLDRVLGQLPNDTFARVRKRLQRSDAKGIEAVVHECVAFELCRTLRMKPTFEPNVENQRPDLSFEASGTRFLADVLVTYRPTSTLRTFGGLQGYEDGGQSAMKISDAVAGKAAKYARLGAPLVVFVMFGRYDVDLPDLETALYGATVEETAIEGVDFVRCHEEWHRHGVFCPPSEEGPQRGLSAVVGCSWFDTLNKAARGRRLHCVVYHNWRPQSAFPLGAFAPFCDLYWRSSETDRRLWPEVSGESDIVMSTTAEDPPQIARYSTDAPW